MKVRKQNAKPCLKKGIDNYKVSSLCELSSFCKECDAFKNSNSDLFKICQEVEEFLTENNLIRYELREMSGLEVLFDGIEKIYNLNSELYNQDHFEGVGPQDFTQMSLNLEFQETSDLTRDLLSKSEDFLDQNQKILTIESVSAQDMEPSILNHIPENLGLTQSFSHDLLSHPPDNLIDSVLLSLYQEGIFEPQHTVIKGETVEERKKRELKDDDYYTVATIMLHGLEDEKVMKKFWPRYTASRFIRNKNKVYAVINRKMHKYLKRFNKFWNLLTDAQVEAINLEWFHSETEKPTQADNAKKLGISIASYQERLELAYKKLEKLYPELDRISRRAPRKTQEAIKPKRKLTPEEKKWARERYDAYLHSLKKYSVNYYLLEQEKSDNGDEETQSVESDS